jgi:serine/threonine protein kinase
VADPYLSGPAATESGGAAALTTAELPFDVPEGDRYALAALLGVGGMGRVYAATDTRLGRQVALKLLRVHGDADAVLQRLVREAWVTARLDHPGIVPVHDAGRTPSGELFYTMRLVRGQTLAAAIDAADTTEARLALVRPVLEASRAVAFAHGHGYVHRDLKPANLLLGPHNETQVADWGVARHDDHFHVSTRE